MSCYGRNSGKACWTEGQNANTVILASIWHNRIELHSSNAPVIRAVTKHRVDNTVSLIVQLSGALDMSDVMPKFNVHLQQPKFKTSP